MHTIELARREREILAAVVEEYVSSGEPVGSRTLSRHNEEHLSPASIRNTLSDLEEKGLLEQPHPSAGRVPTELGFRVYVDSLMRERPIQVSEEEAIVRALDRSVPAPAGLYAEGARILSRLSNHIGVLITPDVEALRLRHIEFIRLAADRIVAILVAQNGVVHNKVFEPDGDYPQEHLDRAGRFLTGTFQGLTLPEMRRRILAMMAEEKARYDRLLRDALELGRATTEEPASGEGRQVFVEGTSNLVAAPEFSDAERLRALFRTFEEKHHLVKILSRCIDDGVGGVRVRIGSETLDPDLSGCTLIASAYGGEGAQQGVVGVIGPMRMEYARAVALVDHVSRLLGRALARYGN